MDAELVQFRRDGDTGSLAEDLRNSLRYPDADVYLVEGSQPLWASLLASVRTGASVVYLCADHGFYNLGHGSFEGQSPLKTVVGRFGRPVVKRVGRWGIDGVVAVSEFAAEFVSPFVSASTPVRIAHPYVQPDRYDSLLTIDPAFDECRAVTIGRGARYKGIDLLVEAWPMIRESHPDAKLDVVGTDHPTVYGEQAGVTVHGYVDDDHLISLLGQASLFIQPSRMDTFPVATLEAMCAGLPPLVTDCTGTRSEARALDAELVVKPTPRSIAAGVRAYFERLVTERERLGAAARERGRQFDRATRTAAFRRAFYDVVARS
ncbi:glycosyltransferase family 4 protein [Haloarcula brevis]|uniref:glycosyltransferase family 4 protein n=1 Tax=Haloarcula brevis TaxID=3111453 RepID=UPI00300F5AC3